VQPVAAQDAGGLGDRLPVEHRDVVTRGAQPVDHLVDLDVVRTVFGHREQQHGSGLQTVEDLDEFLLVRHRIPAVVAPEEHHRGIPLLVRIGVVLQQFIEYTVAEFHESARLGFDGDLPSEGHHRLAHVVAVPRRRRCEDRVADHQDPVPLEDRADELGLRSVVVDRRPDDDDRLAHR
jgi:hypothetical protein